MTAPRLAVIDALLAERYGPPPLGEPGRRAVSLVDDQDVLAERQRVLCEALDGRLLTAIPTNSGMEHAA